MLTRLSAASPLSPAQANRMGWRVEGSSNCKGTPGGKAVHAVHAGWHWLPPATDLSQCFTARLLQAIKSTSLLLTV